MNTTSEDGALPTETDKAETENLTPSLVGESFQNWRQVAPVDNPQNTPVKTLQKTGRNSRENKLKIAAENTLPITNFCSPGRKRKIPENPSTIESCKQPKMSGTKENEQSNASEATVFPQVDEKDNEIMRLLKQMQDDNEKQFKALNDKFIEKSNETNKNIADLKLKFEENSEAWKKTVEKVEGLEIKSENMQVKMTSVEKKIEEQEKLHRELKDNLAACKQLCEKQERALRKNNLIIKGKTFAADNLKSEIDQFFSSSFKLDNIVSSARIISKHSDKFITLVTLDSLDAKKKILQSKKEILGDAEIFIEPDLPSSDLKLNFKLRAKARLEKSLGNQVQIKRQAIKINENWMTWDEQADEWLPVVKVLKNPSKPSSIPPKN